MQIVCYYVQEHWQWEARVKVRGMSRARVTETETGDYESRIRQQCAILRKSKR